MTAVNINSLIRDHLIQKSDSSMHQAIDNILTFLFDKFSNNCTEYTQLEKIIHKNIQANSDDDGANWYYNSETYVTNTKTEGTYPAGTQQVSQLEYSNAGGDQQNLNKNSLLDKNNTFQSINAVFHPLTDEVLEYYKIPDLGEFEFQKYIPSVKFDTYTNNSGGVNAVTSQYFNAYVPACDRAQQLPSENGNEGERFAKYPEQCAFIYPGIAQNDYIMDREFYVELAGHYEIDGVQNLVEKLHLRDEVTSNNQVNELNRDLNKKILIEFFKCLTSSCNQAEGHGPVGGCSWNRSIHECPQQCCNVVKQKQQISQTTENQHDHESEQQDGVISAGGFAPLDAQTGDSPKLSKEELVSEQQRGSSNKIVDSQLLQEGKEEEPEIVKTVISDKDGLQLSNTELNQSGPVVDCSGLPARPFGVMTPVEGQVVSQKSRSIDESNGIAPSIIHSDGNFDIQCSITQRSFRNDTMNIIKDITESTHLKHNVLVKMNRKLDCSARCIWVRELCRNGSVPEVQQYINGYFDIPIYDHVYTNFDQHLCSQYYLPQVLACRYICVMKKFNGDGCFGGTMLGYDLQDSKYVLLKYLKDNVYYGNFIDEIQKILYINAHDRAATYAQIKQKMKNQSQNKEEDQTQDLCPNFVQMLDFFIQHGKPYIVFEYLGESLFSLFNYYQENGRKQLFNLRQMQSISKQILRQIYFLESLCIQNFDLKPENIVLVARRTKKNFFLKSNQDSQATTQMSILQSQNVGRDSTKNYYKDVTNTQFMPHEYKDLANVLQLYKNQINHIELFPESFFDQDDDIVVKLIDIGSYRLLNGDHHGIVAYGQSRFYRAPEVLLKSPADNRAEVFSIGTVIFEILTGNPLFYTSPNLQAHQFHISNMIGLLGPIPIEMILLGNDSHKYFTRQLKLFIKHEPKHISQWLPRENILQSDEEVENIIQEMQDRFEMRNEEQYYYIQPARISFTEQLNYYLDQYECSDDDKQLKKQIHDFLKRCLTIDVRKRPTIGQLLKHDIFLGGDGNFNGIKKDEFKPNFDLIIQETNELIDEFVKEREIDISSQPKPQNDQNAVQDIVVLDINDDEMIISLITNVEEVNLTIYRQKGNQDAEEALSHYNLNGSKIVQYLLSTWGIYHQGDRPLADQ